MDIKEFEKLVKGRRSIRQWKKEEVPDELLKKAVELATWAPNGGNYQGWRFIIVKDRKVIDRMGDTVQYVVDKIASWPEAAPWQEDIKRYQKNASFLKKAPVCIGGRRIETVGDGVRKSGGGVTHPRLLIIQRC